MTPTARIAASIARTPEAVAIGGSEPLTFRELGEAIDACAVALQDYDEKPGTRVGICAKNTVEHLIALLATYHAGKVWVPLNPRNSRSTLDAMIAVTQPGLIIADESCLDRFTPTAAPVILAKTTSTPSSPASIPLSQASTPSSRASIRVFMREHRGRVPEEHPPHPEAEQIIKFSGGSTGAPKAVVQPARCLHVQANGIRDFFRFRDDDVNLIAAPLTHGASCFVLPILEVGARHVLLENPTPEAILETIERERVTTIYAPPTMLYGMLAAVNGTQALTSLRHVIYSAAPMSPERIRECQRVFGPVIETAYGQVEAPQIITAMRAEEMLDERNLLSVGRVSSVAELRIDDGHGGSAERGAVGEICVRGPLLMSGYLGQPELTRQTIVDGWLHTGDTGTLDDRGYLYIRGRLKELINTGGFKVYPADVEAALNRHPAVQECAVFGMPDEKWGEAVTAAVVLAHDARADAHELIAFVKSMLGSVQAPKTIWFVKQLPRNAAGKVSKADLRAHGAPST